MLSIALAKVPRAPIAAKVKINKGSPFTEVPLDLTLDGVEKTGDTVALFFVAVN